LHWLIGEIRRETTPSRPCRWTEFTTFEPHRTNPKKGKKTERYLAKISQAFKCKKQEKEPFSGRYKIIKSKKKRRNVLLFLPAGALFSVKHLFI